MLRVSSRNDIIFSSTMLRDKQTMELLPLVPVQADWLTVSDSR